MKIRQSFAIVAIILLSGCAVSVKDYNELKSRVDILEKKLADQESTVLKGATENIASLTQQNQHIFTQMQAMNNRLLSVENSLQNAQTAKDSVVQETASDNSTDSMLDSIEEYYNEARRLYEIKDYSGAIKVFSLIVENYSDHGLAGPSQYWVGESYYGLGDFTQARTAFQKVVSDYPSSTKFIDAQFKIALCYLNLSQKEKAKVELNRIKKEYPTYERINLIDDYLKKMN